MDLFRCESATLRTHWVLVVMDQYTRRIIGFGVHAGAVDGVTTNRKSPLVWLAAPLSILISDPNGCLTFQIFGLPEVSGQAPQKPRMKSRGLCALGCSALRDSDRFTVTRSVQKGRGISLSWRDLR